MKNKIGVLWSKKDYSYNVENYGKTYNLLFITGMVGAGKSTIARKMATEKKVTILSQDWLGWSEVYTNDELAMSILKEFYKTCPKAQIAAENNYWHRNILNPEERNEIRREYNCFLIDYALKRPNELFIIEGIDVYKVIKLNEIMDRGIIIKGSSAIRCFFRRYKRDKTIENQKNLKAKIQYLNMVIQESKVYYFKDRKIINNLINKIDKY